MVITTLVMVAPLRPPREPRHHTVDEISATPSDDQTESPLWVSSIRPARLVGTYQIACMMIENASASAWPTPNNAIPDTHSHWNVPTNPGDEGIAAPRLITAVRNTNSTGESEIPGAEATSHAAGAQRDQRAQ